MNKFKEDIIMNKELRYYELANIFFETPINSDIVEQLKEIFFSINSITQVYFDKEIDLDSIETVKYLTEISPTMDDSLIEKYILNTDNHEYKKILDMNFFNPNTWNILYRYKNNTSKIIKISIFNEINKRLDKIADSLNLDKYSLIEKVAVIYDFCKMINLDNTKEYELLETLESSCCDSNLYAIIFQKLLHKINIKSFVGEALIDGERINVVIAYIKDDKYSIDGIYLFDPFSDHIDEELPDKTLRTLNYNYFAILLKEYSNTVFSDKLLGILKCLIHDEEYDLEKISFVPTKELGEFEDMFENDFLAIHSIVQNTKDILDSVKLDIVFNITSNELHNSIRENYYCRKNKLFNYNI